MLGRAPSAHGETGDSMAMRILALLLSLLPVLPAVAAAPAAVESEAAFRDLYRELVEINTTRSVGSCTRAAEAMRARLLAAGLPAGDARILAPLERPGDGALVAVLRGREPSRQPILLLAHIDVVEARREDWQRDPFRLVEEDGWFYARGASDDKAMAAVFTDSLVRYHREGFRPRRDIKLALTCGEETPDVFDSVKWLIETQPGVLQAAFALNEGAGGELDASGAPIVLQIQAGEKVYQDFALAVADPGGHSSRPTRNNAIVRLAAGLVRLGGHQFAVAFNPATRAYFESQSTRVAPAIAADMRAVLADPADEAAAGRLWSANPAWNGSLRTTCVVTQISGGHAPNALPQHARANVNCRILPGVPIADVEREIVRVLGDDAIAVSRTGEPGIQAPAPPLPERILGPARRVAAAIWPGVALVPTMSTGATDGRFLNVAGVPTYGLSGMFHDAEGSHAHGLDERIRVASLLNGRRFLYEVVRLYADAGD
jgi:acetylornithine deacetylase/succinyl-diaminopimelate desuccinylase-like protein